MAENARNAGKWPGKVNECHHKGIRLGEKVLCCASLRDVTAVILLLSHPGCTTILGCTQSVCIKCCTDENCAVHKEQRERTAWRELVMAGNTDLQRAARNRRGQLIPKGRFRETNFVYMRDTVVIWDLHQFMATPKLKEEVLRKCHKRKAREVDSTKVLRNNRKRFHRVLEELYQQTLTKP